MARLDAHHEFTGTPVEVFDGIRQYELYPTYIPGVTQISRLEPLKEGSSCRVKYELNLIKKVHYTLNMYEKSPGRIWWDLEDSNIMKVNNGFWELKDHGKGITAAHYSLDVKFRGLVPSAITDKLAKANLPGMFRGFQAIIDARR